MYKIKQAWFRGFLCHPVRKHSTVPGTALGTELQNYRETYQTEDIRLFARPLHWGLFALSVHGMQQFYNSVTSTQWLTRLLSVQVVHHSKYFHITIDHSLTSFQHHLKMLVHQFHHDAQTDSIPNSTSSLLLLKQRQSQSPNLCSQPSV